MIRFLFQLLIWNIYFYISCKCLNSSDGAVKSFLKSPELNSYTLGSNVTLSCKVKLIERTNVVVFRKDKNLKSEWCNVFNRDKYDIYCTTEFENDITYNIFRFTIKHLAWDDRGQWECFYIQNNKFVTIDVHVIPKFDRLLVAAMPSAIEVTSTQLQTKRLMGRGSRTNPYNIRDGTTVNITCLSSCSHPKIIHKWTFQNMTNSLTELQSVIHSERDVCKGDTNKGMVASQSQVTLNCLSLHMVGANKLICNSQQSFAVDYDSSNASVYLLCPGGERPWELTTGEIVGLAVSVGLFVLLVTSISMLVKRSRYSGVSGDDGTNKPYNATMKL